MPARKGRCVVTQMPASARYSRLFVPALGDFITPDLLGGAKSIMIGNLVENQFLSSRDWPFGSAIAFIGMGVVLLGLWAYARVAGQKGGEVL